MLEQLHCRFFRNLDDIRWQPDYGCHLLLGKNGAGKTSLLEAIYVLATTRSFRTARISDCAGHGGDGFHLEGEVESDRRRRLEVGVASTGRYRAVNGRTTGLVEHLRVLSVVAWTSEDVEILSGSPDRRRRVLDQGIVGTKPGALDVLARFRRVLSQKRKLLSQRGSTVPLWNEILAQSASELMTLRRRYLEQLGEALGKLLAGSDLDLPDLRLEYRPSIQVEGDSRDGIREALDRVLARELREGRPLVGPQRDEVVIRWGEQNMRRVGSAGERKLLGLLLTVARSRVLEAAGRAPIVLLDDADSELDRDRLAAVWKLISEARQTFISSSRSEIWEFAREARRWWLEDGCLRLGSTR